MLCLERSFHPQSPERWQGAGEGRDTDPHSKGRAGTCPSTLPTPGTSCLLTRLLRHPTHAKPMQFGLFAWFLAKWSLPEQLSGYLQGRTALVRTTCYFGNSWEELGISACPKRGDGKVGKAKGVCSPCCDSCTRGGCSIPLPGWCQAGATASPGSPGWARLQDSITPGTQLLSLGDN